MIDENKSMAKNIIEMLWLKYTDNLIRNFDYDWMELQALYSKYLVNKRKL